MHISHYNHIIVYKLAECLAFLHFSAQNENYANAFLGTNYYIELIDRNDRHREPFMCCILHISIVYSLPTEHNYEIVENGMSSDWKIFRKKSRVMQKKYQMHILILLKNQLVE